MTSCPRCGSKSVHQSHDTIACLACGHVVNEPRPETVYGLAALLAPGVQPGKLADDDKRARRR